MPYTIAYREKYKKEKTLANSERFSTFIPHAIDERYAYKLRIRGGVAIPYSHRTEDTYPLYFRKIDDSLICRQGNPSYR